MFRVQRMMGNLDYNKTEEYATDDEHGHSHLTIFFDLPKNEGKYRKNLNEIISIDDVKKLKDN